MPYMKIVLIMCFAVMCLDVEAQTKKDILKDAVDPLNLSKQRIGFLRVAGVDSVIDEGEFAKDVESKQLFGRVYDRWSTALKYDKDKSKTLDWFEALAYRQALRRMVLAKYDVNKDKKLKGEEREKAIKDMAGKKTPKLSGDKGASKRGESSVKSTKGKKSMKKELGKGRSFDKKNSKEAKAFMKKYDANGDGKIDGKEKAAIQKDRADDWNKKQDALKDTDKDGVVTLEERREYQKKKSEDGRQYMVKLIDTDKDGKLSRQEIIQANEGARQKARDGQNWMLMKHFDTDGDGKLTDDERAGRGELVAEIKEMERKRVIELLPKYDANKNGKIDSIEAFRLYQDKQEEKVVKEHNGERLDKTKYMVDGKFNFSQWLRRPDQIDSNIMSEAANFGELISMPAEKMEKVFEREKELQAARERATRARERNIRKQLERGRK